MSLSCPLCSLSLPPEELEAHLRFELDFPLLRCLLCREAFVGRREAREHFRGAFARHRDSQPQLLGYPSDPAKQSRLLELLRLANGPPAETERRLCVCGHCQLLCREENGQSSGPLPSADNAQSGSEPQRPAEPKEESEQPRPEPMEDPAMPVEVQAPMESSHPVTEQYEQPIDGDQQAQEACEEELSTARDVKPDLRDLKDLKPQLASDGKVACLQCAKRVERNSFSHHVRFDHTPGKPFQCLLCPESAKLRGLLAKHQKNEHGTELSSDTYTSSLSQKVIKDWIKLCFGEAKSIGYKGLRCRPCDKSVRSQDLKSHIARLHLRKPLHKCKSCDYASVDASLKYIGPHVKVTHKLKPSPETIDSSGLQHYEPIIKAMIPQLFDQ